MDKNTLSNYGWIVIAVLVLSVMIALATPFGGYIRAGVENTVQGLFETEDAALGKVLDDMGIVPTTDQLQSKHKFDYYSTFRGAIADANANTIGVNADATKDSATAGIYTDENGGVNVVLLQDTTEATRISPAADMTINLGGNTLTIENDYIGIVGAKNHTDTITIDGHLDGSAVVLNGVVGGGYSIQTRTNNFIINGGTYKIIESISYEGVASVLYVSSGGSATINDCEIIGINTSEDASKKNAGVCGVINSGNTTINNTITKGYSNYMSSTTGGVASHGIANLNTLTLNNCYAFGTHSGIQNLGTLYVNGGTYEGYGHGGFYFSGNGTTSYVRDAIIRQCAMLDGYTATNSTNDAGLYIGGTVGMNNISVYMDNCDIYGSRRPIVLRGTDGEQNNSLYISNSNINTSAKIRIDNDTHKLYIGKGNNFTAENTTRPSSVIITDETYCQ